MFNIITLPDPDLQDDTGRRHFPLGEGLTKNPSAIPNMKKDNLVQLPISVVMNEAIEDGKPLSFYRPNGAEKELAAFRNLTDIVARELLLLQYGSPSEDNEYVVFENETALFNLSTTTLAIDKGRENVLVRLFSDSAAIQKHFSPAQLRARDPKTGETMPDSPYLNQDGGELQRMEETNPVVTLTKPTQKRSPSVKPTKVERRGRYGFAVEWADGATIIYSMRCLARAAGGILTDRKP